MRGLAYKEWKQICLLILGAMLLAVFASSGVPVGLMRLDMFGNIQDFTEYIRTGNSAGYWMTGIVLGYFLSALLQTETMRADGRKAWSMFAASSPDGVSGYLRVKYEMILVMIVLTMFGLQLSDWFMGMYSAAHDAEWSGTADSIIVFCYMQIFIRAIDLPFIVRFGVKIGSLVKMNLLLAFFIVFLAVFLLYDEAILAFFTEIPEKIAGTAAAIMLSLLPVISLAAYYLSYRISCRLYLKGAALYDR